MSQETLPHWVPCYATCQGFTGFGRRHIKLWEEDDARPPDAETISEASQRIFGDDYTIGSTEQYDGGDAFYYFCRGNRVAMISPCGCALYQYLPERKFE